MATRFYLPFTGTAAVTPTILTGWEVTAGWGAFPTDTAKTNTTTTAGAPRPKNNTTANDDRLDRIYISTKQLAAQTISAGTFSAVLRAVQSASTTDAWLQIMIRVVSADGTTQRGVIFGGSTATTEVATAGADAQEYGTTSSTRIKNAIATSSVVAQDGDRIQIEIGARINGTTSADTFTHRYGDETAAGDFALTAGLTTDLSPWVELSVNLTWYVSAADTAAGTDALTVAAGVPLADTGAGTDAVTVGVGASLSDTAAATDALAVSNAVALTDTAAGTDALAVAIALPLADTGAATDGLTTAAAVPLADTGTGTDALAVEVPVALDDTATAADALTVAVDLTLTDDAAADDAFSYSDILDLAPLTGPVTAGFTNPGTGTAGFTTDGTGTAGYTDDGAGTAAYVTDGTGVASFV